MKKLSTMKESITPNESVLIIEEMLQKTKSSLIKSSPFFIIWGFLMISAGVGEYILKELYQYHYFYVVWPIAGVLGGIMSGIYGSKYSSDPVSNSFTGKIINQVWMGYVITMVLIIIGSVTIRQNPGSFVMLLTGLPTYLTGRILNFKPLVYGAISLWLMGILSFYLPPQYTSLIFSLSLITGYIIPGLLLRRIEMKNRS